jgi:leukotriene-A4 hydrolase
MPPYDPGFSTKLSDCCHALAKSWLSGGDGCTLNDISGWTSGQISCFLDYLIEHNSKITKRILAQMEFVLKFTEAHNAEILYRWLLLCLKVGYTDTILIRLKEFITSQGRMKFVRPLYQLYYEVDPADAQTLFLQHRNRYHAIAQKMLAKDVWIAEGVNPSS